IHGRKNGSFVHVDGIDSVFTRTEALALGLAVAAAGGTECYALAWEFEMDLRLALAAIEQDLGVKIKPVFIPREIMEKTRKGTPPFVEMAVVEAEAVYRSGSAPYPGPLPGLAGGPSPRPSPRRTGERGQDGGKAVDIKLTRFL